MTNRTVTTVSLLLLLLLLLQLVSTSVSEKSFRLESVSTDVDLPQNECVVRTRSAFTFNFLGYVYQRVGIPIRRDSVYRFSNTPSSLVSSLLVHCAMNETVVTQASIVAPDASDTESAYVILISFNAPAVPLTRVTFTVQYAIDGYLTQDQDGASNVARWSVKSGFSDIADLAVRFRLPAAYNISRTQIVASPVGYATTVTETLVEFKRAPLPASQVFAPSVRFPMRVANCVVSPPSPLAIILVVSAVIAVACICVPVCCCLGALSRLGRGNLGMNSATFYNRGFNEPYTTVVYHNNNTGYGSGYHHNSHHHHHSSSGSGSGSKDTRSSGSVYAV